MPAFDIHSVPAQTGRIALVTGANTGLGFETAQALASKGAHVILACRNPQKAKQAIQDIRKAVPEAQLEFLQLDLGNLGQIREAAEQFKRQHTQLDLLINNAGVMMPPYQKTTDGFELQLGTNHLGHFLLTGLLLPILNDTPDARIVTVSSLAHRSGEINFTDLQSEKAYSKMKAYAQSKLANLLFTYELKRRMEAQGISTLSLAAHPGISMTDLGRHMPKFLQAISPVLGAMFAQSPKAGAEPTLYAALGEDVENGDYFGPGSRREYRGRAAKVSSTRRSHDEKLARRLWKVSEELTGFSYELPVAS